MEERRVLTEEEKERFARIIREILSDAPEGSEGWMHTALLGNCLLARQVSYKQYASKLPNFLEYFSDMLEFRKTVPEPGKTPVAYTRLKDVPAAEEIPPTAPTTSTAPAMQTEDRTACAAKLVQVLENLQEQPGDWVDLARVGAPLALAGIQYKQYGFPKLGSFLETFTDILEFHAVEPEEEGKSPIRYARPLRTAPADSTAAPIVPAAPKHTGSARRIPHPETDLYAWAAIGANSLNILADLALPEDWSGGDSDPRRTYAILRRYLKYTFLRLTYENKVLIAQDPDFDDPQEEYAAFNTGLVDRKYEYIYALFKKCTQDKGNRYWYLLAFVVPGEDAGKTLIRVFNPLPQKADYFGNKIENMLYDTTTGSLSCDYTHMLIERCSRLPIGFLKDNCPSSMLDIDGISIDEAYALNALDSRRIAYFAKLGNRIHDDIHILNRLKYRFKDATDMALKRVEWNYKTAIPMYYPKKNRGSLLLPLALVEDNQVDLALVVSRHSNGSYQGETILPLSMAYQDSRLVSRPDSDWLQPSVLAATGTADDANDLDDED